VICIIDAVDDLMQSAPMGQEFGFSSKGEVQFRVSNLNEISLLVFNDATFQSLNTFIKGSFSFVHVFNDM
jgi:hypothetical protein